jgi:hypothetical protein
MKDLLQKLKGQNIEGTFLFPQMGQNPLDYKVVDVTPDKLTLETTVDGQRFRAAIDPDTVLYT